MGEGASSKKTAVMEGIDGRLKADPRLALRVAKLLGTSQPYVAKLRVRAGQGPRSGTLVSTPRLGRARAATAGPDERDKVRDQAHEKGRLDEARLLCATFVRATPSPGGRPGVARHRGLHRRRPSAPLDAPGARSPV